MFHQGYCKLVESTEMKSRNMFTICILIASLGAAGSQSLYAQEWERLMNLKGYWKFSIGDDMKWALPDYNDRDWEEVFVPSMWEDQGFYGYNGYAWYRKDFETPSDISGEMIYLELGRIDDVDETYINGNKVGFSGKFPPNYETAYSAYRRYPVPVKYLKPKGKNVIAVRVYDSQLAGGITDGNIAFYQRPYGLNPDLGLEGEWKFKIGDDMKWKEPSYNDKDWGKIIVPGVWDSQGFGEYDGYAWYRITFNASARLKDKKLVLLMGKIDDYDQVYLNGELIGSTGDMKKEPRGNNMGDAYAQFRGYYILNNNLLKINQENVLAVRVYDGWRYGGITEGPIGLITQDKYVKYWREQKKKGKSRDIFEFFWD